MITRARRPTSSALKQVLTLTNACRGEASQATVELTFYKVCKMTNENKGILKRFYFVFELEFTCDASF